MVSLGKSNAEGDTALDFEEQQRREELRAQITRDLKPKLKAEVVKQVREEVRLEVEKEVTETFRQRLPTVDERASAVRLLNELRTDCVVRAQTMSDNLDATLVRLARSKRIFTGLAVTLLLMFAPMLSWLERSKTEVLSLGWWAFVVPAVLGLFLTAGRAVSNPTDRVLELGMQKEAIATYTALAQRALQASQLEVGLKTSARELNNFVFDIALEKRALDEKHHLSVRDTKLVRIAVNQDKVLETDPDDFLRIPHSDVRELEVDEEAHVGQRKG